MVYDIFLRSLVLWESPEEEGNWGYGAGEARPIPPYLSIHHGNSQRARSLLKPPLKPMGVYNKIGLWGDQEPICWFGSTRRLIMVHKKLLVAIIVAALAVMPLGSAHAESIKPSADKERISIPEGINPEMYPAYVEVHTSFQLSTGKTNPLSLDPMLSTILAGGGSGIYTVGVYTYSFAGILLYVYQWTIY